jgi:tetratricopeptide (TPR) repeat protein
LDRASEQVSVPALLRKGKSLRASGRWGPAFQIALSIVKGAPADARGYLLAAEVLEENLRPRAALDFVERGLRVAPGHKQLALMSARLLRLVGDTAASVASYESLVDTYPWSATLKVELGRALIANGEAERGLPVIEGALAPNGSNSRGALKSLVFAHVQSGNLARAREVYERIHLDSHSQLVSALPDGAIAARLASGEDDRSLANCGPALAELATQPNPSLLLRPFLNAAGDVAGLSADRNYYFPHGRSPGPVARLDRALASSRATLAEPFVDSRSSVLGLTYRTTNLGDDVQSLAALNLTGRVKAFIERDRLDEPGPSGKIVLNGWWGHHRSFPIATRDLSIAWPPRADLDPLMLSLHLDPLRAALYLTREGIAYLKEHEPIGCRDRWTERLLQRCGVVAYFSGCLTLTLPRYEGPRTHRVLLVDLPDRVVPHISQAIARHCKYKQKVMTHDIVRSTLDPVRRLNAANLMLQHYARSAFVATTRLHVALPCLAVGTPVLFLARDAHDPRFDGLSALVNMVPLADAMEDGRLLDPARWPVRTEHLALRQSLTDAVRAFMGR